MRWPLALVGVLSVLVVGGCAAPSTEGRGAPEVEVSMGVSDSQKDMLNLPQHPEAYGLPSLEALRADPYAVATELSSRSLTNAWTVKWKIAAAGEEGGTMSMAHIPPSGGSSDRIHATGFVDAGEGRTVEVAILDNGDGPHACLRRGTQPYVCDKGEFDLVLRFLSVKSLSELTRMLRDAMSKPGAAVVYKLIAGEPSTCFLFPPTPVTRQTLGLDFESGGVFCLSRLGAIMKIETAQASLDAIEYTPSADPAEFTLPV